MKEIVLFNESNGIKLNLHQEGEMVSLTDLWKSVGEIKSKAPKHWLGNETTKAFIKSACTFLKVTESYLIKIKAGKGGGTYAHKHIALEYAQYLDPNLAVAVNQVFFERIEEEKNPHLLLERYDKHYKKLGKTEDWIGVRIKSTITRNIFTKVLSSHGVKQEGFKNCTNAIYTPLFGGSTDVVRKYLKIDKNKSIRDNCSKLQLMAIEFSEELASANIKKNNLQGNAACEIASRNAGQIVRNALNQALK